MLHLSSIDLPINLHQHNEPISYCCNDFIKNVWPATRHRLDSPRVIEPIQMTPCIRGLPKDTYTQALIMNRVFWKYRGASSRNRITGREKAGSDVRKKSIIASPFVRNGHKEGGPVLCPLYQTSTSLKSVAINLITRCGRIHAG